ncbi:DUF3857 domain-containing protein [Shewanella japonica]|uniref:DUF3857 domain-containing protein n=1 Tax=Shewanella japonica TaxID=93973 RepID=UPI000E750477|nr:DUF3857 domain-containing protein [Shewanella japonica]
MSWCSTQFIFVLLIQKLFAFIFVITTITLPTFSINAQEQEIKANLTRHNLDKTWYKNSFAEKGVVLTTQPKWVQTIDNDSPPEPDSTELSDGVYHVILDNQIKVSDSDTLKFSRYVTKAVTAKGLEYVSQISIDFDPTYEKIAFHGITLHRDGERINKNLESQFSLDKRDSATDLIYDGTLTAFWLINDVRVGDTIEYSYTREGANPVYNNHFSYNRSLQWSVPIHKQFLRVIWGRSTPLNVKFHNSERQFKTTKLGKETDYQLLLQDNAPLSISSDAAIWYSPYEYVEVSSLPSWASVINWALPLFEKQVDDSDLITRQVQQIKKQSSVPKEQLVLALNFVQQDIRYMGLEMGSNSHFPAKASETLLKRYGDCKDKTVLLLALLRKLNITASATLVNSENGKILNKYLPSPQTFNHAIVKAELDEKTYWLDPTLLYQDVNLDELYQPDYGFGLVIKDGNKALESLANSNSGSKIDFKEHYDLSEGVKGNSTFNSVVTLTGQKARQLRAKIENNSVTELSETYASYYNSIFNGIEIAEPLKVDFNPQQGNLSIEENYRLTSAWTQDDDEGYKIYFYESQIAPYLSMPEGFGVREIALAHPLTIQGVITAKLRPQNWDFDPELIKEDNRFFSTIFKLTFDKESNLLTLNYSYQSKVDHVKPSDIQEYSNALANVTGIDSYGIVDFDNPSTPTVINEPSTLQVFIDELGGLTYWIVAIICFGIGVLFTIVSLLDETKHQTTATFYPISFKKFILLGLFSFSLYLPYWSYKNWQFIKATHRSDIWPIARAFFNPLWFYALFMWMEVDSEQRNKRNWLIPTWAAGLSFIALISYNIVNNNISVSVVSYIIPIALFLPLVLYANKVNGRDSEAYIANSTLYIRNWVFMICAIPLLALILAQEANLIAKNDVINGKNLWQHDISFMQDNEMIQAGSSPIYFYSESFFSLQEAGNGFTQDNVFSYWTENDELHKVSAAFTSVENITVEYSDSETEETQINIFLENKDEFFLLVTASSAQDKVFVDKLLQQWNASKTPKKTDSVAEHTKIKAESVL